MPFSLRPIVLIAFGLLACGPAYSTCADGGPLTPLSADTSVFDADPVQEAYENAGGQLDAIYGSSGINMAGRFNFQLTYNVNLWDLRVGGNVITGCLRKNAGETFTQAMVRQYLEEQALIDGTTPDTIDPVASSGTASSYSGGVYTFYLSYSYAFYHVVFSDGSTGLLGRLVDLDVEITPSNDPEPGEGQMR